MIEKKIREAEWTVKHTLTKEQFQKLIQNKVKRVEQYHRAVSKQESRPNARYYCNVVGETRSLQHTINSCKRAATRMESLVWD